MVDLTYDVAVIEAGTAGLAATRAARDEGANTLLVDPEFAGTVCAQVGCIPSKLLIAAGKTAKAVACAERFGISVQATIDGRNVMKRMRNHRDGFIDGVNESIAELPDETKLRSKARFLEPGVLELNDGRRISSAATVIATGSDPRYPKPTSP